jgi:glutamyl-Q tRNA(Asp) synthetase
LHLGHAWSAIQAHDFAKGAGGKFFLRIEDIDGTRSRPEHVRGIIEDMEWLGLGWDGPVMFQSERLGRYAEALERLKAMGLLYPCFCTRADIAASASAPHGPEGALYPGTCRRLAEVERKARMDEPHAWRIDMAAAAERTGPLEWLDEIAGVQAADPLSHGDVVLARKDAPASYHLAVTVDDAAQGVSHVVRGIDLFAATHVHRLLQALLNVPVPVWRHHSLLTDARGNRLAKRTGAPTLASLRDAFPDGRVLADMLRSGTLPNGYAKA